MVERKYSITRKYYKSGIYQTIYFLIESENKFHVKYYVSTFENNILQTSPDGNVTLSTLNYIPSVRDAGKFMSCRAENPELPDATLEDGWKLEIYCKIFKLGNEMCN